MLRLVFVLTKIFILVALFLAVRHYTGLTTFQLFDLQVSLDTSLVFLLLVGVVLVVYSLTSFWHRLLGVLARRRHQKDVRNWRHSLSSLLKAEQALLEGQTPDHHLERGIKLGNDHLYIRYREAVSCAEFGELQKAEQIFLALSHQKETKLLALTRLAKIAKDQQQLSTMWQRALTALKLAPHSPLLHQLLLETCLEYPEFSDRFAQEVQPLLSRQQVATQQQIKPLYIEWLLQRSRQQEASNTTLTSGHSTAVKFAKEAFALSKDQPLIHALAFERLIHSLIVEGKEKNVRKAGKLLQQHWHEFASLGHGRTYRDIILRGKTTAKKIQAIRTLLKKVRELDTSRQVTTEVILAETLIESGIWGEAHTILKRIAKEHPHQHKETRVTLAENVQRYRQADSNAN